MTFTLCACTLHQCCKHAACAPHARLCRVHACRRHMTSHVIHLPHTCDIHPAHTLHTPNMPYTCPKPCLTHTACACIPATRMPCVGCTLSTCTYSCMHRHTKCKNITSLLHLNCMYPQCLHAPCKQHSSCTHATRTCITDYT
jgi:hypothetical protein